MPLQSWLACDRSHYMPWSDFLSMDMDFWIGSGGSCAVDDGSVCEVSGARTPTAQAPDTKGAS
jgi:hypothetical protein